MGLESHLILADCCLSSSQKRDSHVIPRAMWGREDGSLKPLPYPVSHSWCLVLLCSELPFPVLLLQYVHIMTELPCVALEWCSHVRDKSAWKSNHLPFDFWCVSMDGFQRTSLHLCWYGSLKGAMSSASAIILPCPFPPMFSSPRIPTKYWNLYICLNYSC